MDYVVYLYKESGTPFHKDSRSPCFPVKEFLEEELHMDKSTAFREEYLKGNETWKCGINFVYTEFGIATILFFLITMQKRLDVESFK